MTSIFHDLMNGLSEVNDFLGGKTAGYKVNVPIDADVKNTSKRLNTDDSRKDPTCTFSGARKS